MISTLLVTKKSSESVFMDILVEIGGFIAAMWFLLMPIGKWISRKLYDADLIQSLYLYKDLPGEIELSPEKVKEAENEEYAMHDSNVDP